MTQEEVMSNPNIALFALYKLGGVSKKIHTEDIAWEAYNMAKEKFSWSLPRYRSMGFPDKTTVRYALETAKKQGFVKGRAGKNKGGSGSEGWQLTAKGTDFVMKEEKKISLALNTNVPISKVRTPDETVPPPSSTTMVRSSSKSSAMVTPVAVPHPILE